MAAAKDDREQAKALRALSDDAEISREIVLFRKSVEARFGEDGAREILRASAAGRTFEHPSLQSVPQHFRDQVASLYSVVRNGELQKTRTVLKVNTSPSARHKVQG